MSDAATTPDLASLKPTLRRTWMDGDFGRIATSVEQVAEDFVARRSVGPGVRVLDVGCGNGNSALVAAKAGAEVTGVDIATNLLEQARTRAQREGVNVDFAECDAEDLPYPDDGFDLVISMFGAMFAPRPEHVATELTRVCRPGGRVAMANWTPDSFVAEMARTQGAHVPPPPGLPSPFGWGHEATVRERLADDVAEMHCAHVTTSLAYPFPPAVTVEFWRTYYGPTKRAFEALAPDAQAALRRDLEAVWSRHDQAGDGTTRVDATYLEVVAVAA